MRDTSPRKAASALRLQRTPPGLRNLVEQERLDCAARSGVEIVSHLATRRLTIARPLRGCGARERRPHTEETAQQNAGRSRQQK